MRTHRIVTNRRALVHHAYTIALTGALAMVLIACYPTLRAEAATFSNDLQVGSRGSDVTVLQTFLAGETGLYPEKLVTGYFGSLTKASVTRFQERESIAQVGRVGPITRARLNSLPAVAALPQTGFGIGGSDDVHAPIMSAESVTIGSNMAAISWTTNESAWPRVMYATSWPFLYATAASVSSKVFDSNASITLRNLAPNTTYYYVRESIDVGGNVMWTVAKSFRTLAATP